MKRFLTVFLVVILALSLFGCGGSSDNKKTKLVMWIMPNSQEPTNDVMSILRPFLNQNPDIEIEVVALDWGSAWQKITTAATAKDAPDIVQLGSTWVGSISSMGAMADLKDYIAKDGGKNLFIDSAWTFSGPVNSTQIVAIPWFVDIRAMYYRTDVFKRLGLTQKDVATWDSFEKALAKIKKADLTIDNKKVDALGITGKNDWNILHNLAPWIWAAGGDFLNKDYTASGLNTPESVNGINYYVSLVRKGYVPMKCLEQNSYQINTDFNYGYYAVTFDGPYALKALTTPPERGGSGGSFVAKNFGVAPYPKGPKGRYYAYCGGSGLAMFKTGKHPEESWKVIRYLTTDEKAQVAYAQLTGYLPTKKSAFTNPYFSNDPFRKVFTDSVKNSKAYPCIAAWGPIETVVLTRRFGLMWDEVVKNSKAFDKNRVKEQMDMAAKEMDVVLEQK